MKNYPLAICSACGLGFGQHKRLSTFHYGKCDVCGQDCAVTEARDFEPLRLPKEFMEKPKCDLPDFMKNIFNIKR